MKLKVIIAWLFKSWRKWKFALKINFKENLKLTTNFISFLQFFHQKWLRIQIILIVQVTKDMRIRFKNVMLRIIETWVPISTVFSIFAFIINNLWYRKIHRKSKENIIHSPLDIRKYLRRSKISNILENIIICKWYHLLQNNNTHRTTLP